jgi:hypothetical protein
MDILDLLLLVVVVLGGAIVHWMIPSFLVASGSVALTAILVAAVYFESSPSESGGAPMMSIALVTIGLAVFVGASIIGIIVRWLKRRFVSAKPGT